MNSLNHQKSLRQLFFQRNVLLGLTVLLAFSQSVLSTFLFFKNERTIIVPAVINKEFWVNGDNVSATYLEQFGYFLSQLVLNKSAQSAPTQRMQVLRHTTAEFSGELNRKLMDEEAMLIKQNASYVFYPVDIQVNPDKFEVLLKGDRTFYISGKPVSTQRESYLLSFSYSGARLLLNEIKSVEVK